jgi:hypothetical protein
MGKPPARGAQVAAQLLSPQKGIISRGLKGEARTARTNQISPIIPSA